MTQSEKQTLIEAISSAWKDVPCPGTENIFTPDSYDDEGITEYFKDTTWHGHKPEILRGFDSAISTFFTNEAYHYWLPAFLIAAVENPEELSQGTDAIVRSFIPEDYWRKEEYYSRMAMLTNEQKMVIISVIEHLAEFHFHPDYPDAIEEEKLALKYLYENTSMA